MNNNSVNIGAKYYRYYDDEILKIGRLLKIEKDKYIMVDSANKKLICSKEEFTNWSKILPHGYITFMIAEVNEYPDVIVSFVKTDDIINTNGNYIPCVVARQQMPSSPTIGGCINNISMVPNPSILEYLKLNPDDKVIDMSTIAVYRDDSIYDILRNIPLSNINRSLYKFKHKSPRAKNIYGGYHSGVYDNIEDFLKQYHFIDAMYNQLGVGLYNGEVGVIDEKDEDELNNIIIDIFNNMAPAESYKNPSIVHYQSEFIDLDKMQRKFFLIRDKKGLTYLIVYS